MYIVLLIGNQYFLVLGLWDFGNIYIDLKFLIEIHSGLHSLDKIYAMNDNKLCFKYIAKPILQ